MQNLFFYCLFYSLLKTNIKIPYLLLERIFKSIRNSSDNRGFWNSMLFLQKKLLHIFTKIQIPIYFFTTCSVYRHKDSNSVLKICFSETSAPK